jgi:hypothetical protein
VITGNLSEVNTDLATLHDTNTTSGVDNIAVSVTDSFGHSASTSIAVTVAAAPQIFVPAPQTFGINQNDAIPGVSVTESSASASETFTVTLSDSTGNLSTTTTAAGSTITGSGTHTLVITGNLSEVNTDLASLHDQNSTAGVDNIAVSVTDGFHNSASASIAVTVTSELMIPVGGSSSYNGGTITVNVDNDGTLAAISSHTLTITGDITSDGTLTGTLSIINSATLVLDGDVSSQNIVFGIGGGTTPELVLGDPNDFAASSSISSFGPNGTIDLPTIAFGDGATSISIKAVQGTPETTSVGGETITVFDKSSTLTVITISEGTTTAILNLTGTDYNNVTFTFSRDSVTQGGTQFVDPLAINSGSTLELQSASAESVSFINNAGNTGTLLLDDPIAFSGLIYGFTGTGTMSDAIDLKGITLDSGTTWSYTENSAGTGGTLTFYEGTTVVDTINFVGSYTIANFAVGSDGNGGTLITDTLSGGVATIAGNELIIDAQSNVNVTFNNGTGTPTYGELVLADAPTFTGQIFGFTGTAPGVTTSDAIDLRDINFAKLTTETYTENSAGTGGVLIVSDGTNTVTLSFSGNYTIANFNFASDGQGGTLITDPPPGGATTTTTTVDSSSTTMSTGSPLTSTSTDSSSTTWSTNGSSTTAWTDSSSNLAPDIDQTAKQRALDPHPADLPALSALPQQGSNNTISQTLLGAISKPSAGDALDLTDIAFGANTTLGYSPNDPGIGGSLGVSDGTHTATIALFNQFAAAGFQLGNNNNGALVTNLQSLASENEMLITNPHKS